MLNQSIFTLAVEQAVQQSMFFKGILQLSPREKIYMCNTFFFHLWRLSCFCWFTHLAPRRSVKSGENDVNLCYHLGWSLNNIAKLLGLELERDKIVFWKSEEVQCLLVLAEHIKYERYNIYVQVWSQYVCLINTAYMYITKHDEWISKT